jgi:hypothetical protein
VLGYGTIDPAITRSIMPQSLAYSRKARLSRLLFALTGVAVLSLGLLACGGGDDEDSSGGSNGGSTSTAAAGTGTAAAGNGGGSTAVAGTSTAAGGTGTPAAADGGNTDTSRADEIAHAALITEQDLPGTGWTVHSTDEFGSSVLGIEEEGSPEVCSAYNERIRNAAQQSEAARIGRAAKSFSASDASFAPPSVDIEINVYEDDDIPADLISEAKSALDSDDFQTCFEELIKGDEGDIPEDVTYEFESVDPHTDAPHDGVAEAYNIKFSFAGIETSFHAELYAWADGNATAFVSLFGEPDSITAELAEAAVGKTADKLSDAQ